MCFSLPPSPWKNVGAEIREVQKSIFFHRCNACIGSQQKKIERFQIQHIEKV